MTTAAFLDDLTKLRARTRKHSFDGAAAVGDVARRTLLIELLNDVLASELVWLMRYRRNLLQWRGKPRLSGASANEEPTPADRIARRIIELGGVPDLDPDHLLSKSRADYASCGPLADRIREDLQGERIVIGSYREVLDYLGATDPATKAVLADNLSRERERATQLAQILLDLEGQAVQAAG
jgi:bacterioferritin